MKRILCLSLFLTVLSVGAEQERSVAPSVHMESRNTEANRFQASAREPVANASTVKDFLDRLHETVQRGHVLAKSGAMDPVKQRNHAAALARLREESEKFAVLDSPYSECTEAAIDAVASWQGLSADNYHGFTENHIGYVGAAGECSRALN